MLVTLASVLHGETGLPFDDAWDEVDEASADDTRRAAFNAMIAETESEGSPTATAVGTVPLSGPLPRYVVLLDAMSADDKWFTATVSFRLATAEDVSLVAHTLYEQATASHLKTPLAYDLYTKRFLPVTVDL